MVLSKSDISKLEQVSLQESLKLIVDLFPGQVVFSSSLGQEDQVITDAIFKHNIPVTVFTIDTGRLFNETYELLDKTIARYKQPVKVYFPDATDVEAFVQRLIISKRQNGCVAGQRRFRGDGDVCFTHALYTENIYAKPPANIQFSNGFPRP